MLGAAGHAEGAQPKPLPRMLGRRGEHRRPATETAARTLGAAGNTEGPQSKSLPLGSMAEVERSAIRDETVRAEGCNAYVCQAGRRSRSISVGCCSTTSRTGSPSQRSARSIAINVAGEICNGRQSARSFRPGARRDLASLTPRTGIGRVVEPQRLSFGDVLLRGQVAIGWRYLAPVENSLQFVGSLAKRIPVASAIARFARPGVGVRDRDAPGHNERLQLRLAIIGLS